MLDAFLVHWESDFDISIKKLHCQLYCKALEGQIGLQRFDKYHEPSYVDQVCQEVDVVRCYA